MASRATWVKRVILFLACSVAVVALGWMFWIGRNVPYAEQIKLYEMLRNVAGTMFAVFGLWIALLYPELRKKVFGRRSTNAESVTASSDAVPEDKQADHLLQPFFMSLFILLITVVVDVIGPLIRRVDIFRDNFTWVRAASYTLIGLLAISQLLSIFRAMGITDGLKAAISRAQGEKNVRQRIRQNRDDTPRQDDLTKPR